MAYLQLETPDGVRRVPLTRARVSIGRLPSNDVVLPYRQISRYHAELQREGGTWWIVDLHSTNGIQIAGLRIDRQPLGPGERVQLAPGLIMYLVADDAEAAPDPAVMPTSQMAAQGRPPAVAAAPSAAGDQSPYAPDAKRMWLPPPRTAPWPGHDRPRAGTAGNGASAAGEPASSAVEGDVFRRQHAPTPPPAPPRPTDATAPGRPPLHLCQTCGQLTDPAAIHCQSCHNSIAQPCRGCGLDLLPIQDRCPRCHTPNSYSVHRSPRGAASP
jgi:hypothetical protein